MDDSAPFARRNLAIDLEATLSALEAAEMPVPGGSVVLHDARTKRHWTVDFDEFLLGPYPVTKGLYGTVMEQVALSPHHLAEPFTDVSWNEAVADDG